jgi:predicted metalloenzyme YecM
MSKVNDLTKFLDKFTSRVGESNIDVSNYNMDHVAYLASSANDYEEVRDELLSEGSLVHEPIIGGRRVGMIKLNKPIAYKGNNIIALEIVENKPEQVCKSGWEHAEYVVNESFDELMSKYPNLDWDRSSADRDIWAHLKLKLSDSIQLKFHKMNILETIELDKND